MPWSKPLTSYLQRLVVVGVLGLISFSAMARKVRVEHSTTLAPGDKLIADYGSFKIIETESTKGEACDAFNVITLNAGHLDTTKPEIKALRKNLASFTGQRLHLIHFAGPIKPEWRKELENAGVKIISYIPNNAYLVYGDTKAIAKIQAYAKTAPHVQWDGAYADLYKTHPAALSNSTNAFAIQLVADAAANAATLKLIDQWKLEPIQQQFTILHYLNIVVRIPPEKLALLAAQPDVISIHQSIPPKKNDERQAQIVAGNLSGNIPNGPGYLAWLASKGFTQAQFDASGFTVDVSDFGVDNGTTAPNHFALYKTGGTTNTSRVVYNRLEGTTAFGTSLTGCDGHGTINAHIIGGYDDQSGFPHTDGSGYHYGLGICPFVRLGSSVIFEPPAYFTSPDYANLESEAWQGGARINNNSWGSSAGGAYDINSQAYDALVRDAQPDGSTYGTNGNQEMVIVFAAGNDGPTPQTIGVPGTAKNVITVGASENVQATGGDGCSFPDNDADNANDIWAESSRGPCSDGRHKPDLVAPGTHISGGVIQAPSPGPTGTADTCYNSSSREICGGASSLYYPLGQQFFTISSGTSHAAPCVSGGCALLRQYFINNFTNPPSPAMTKAYLMNAARYLTGASANDSLWSDHQGMGELNLGAAFDGAPRLLRDQQDLFTASGQTRTFTGTIADTNKPFRVTVAWTDAPGNTSGEAYNNDLDLTVTVGGNTYKGNVFNGAFSTTGGSADFQNNVESVFLPAGTSGNFSVTITAADINSDGVPNNTNDLDQDFALVINNAVSGAAPILATGTALLTENDSPTNGVIDPGETVTVNFSLANIGLTNTTNLVATLQSSSSVIAPSGPQNYGVITAGGASISQPFTFTANGICGGNFIAVLQLQDGTKNLGKVDFNISLGQFITPTIFTQSFDTVTVPALPTGWTTAISGGQANWVTTNTTADSAPNSAFASEAGTAGVSELISPVIAIASSSAQLTFQHRYNMEVHSSTLGYDGGVLEISTNGGAYIDILSAGGTFQTGDYNRTISSVDNSPIAGRRAWSGNSGGFVTTVVNLPATTAGQNVRLKWRCATDSSTGGAGWYIDTISLTDGSHPACPEILVVPQISRINVTGNDVAISFLSIGGLNYNLEYKASLSLTNWTDQLPAATGTGDILTLHATNASPVPHFYRLRVSP